MSKRISDVTEATRIDSNDQILFLQASSKKTKRISRDNFAKSPGFGGAIPELSGDIEAPATPTGLAVTTASEIMPDGTERVIIRAKITPNTEEDLESYSWYLRRASGTPTFDGGGVLTGYSVAQVFTPVLESMPAEGSIGTDGKVTKEWTVVANSYYEVRVAAFDTGGNFSDYTQLNNTNVILSSKDSLAPNAPTSVAATSAIRSVFLTWVNPADKDLAYVRVFRPTNVTNAYNIVSATRSATTVTITTATAHGYANGNSATVVGLSGTVNPNGSKTVTVVNSTQFTYTIASATGSETYTITNGTTTLTSNVFAVFDGYADAFTDTSTEQGKTYSYWLTAVDYSGNESTFPSNVARTTPGTVETTDVKDFAINATKMYNNTIVLEGDSWTSNTGTFTISWNSHFLYYRGVKYTVASGSLTASSVVADARTAYVYATIPVSGSTITYSTFVVTGTTPPNDYPVLTDSMFMIATNVNGAYDLAWNAIANAVIGSAYIKNAAIDSAKIREVIADRISTGTIDAKTLTITGGGVIKSAGVTNFTTGQGFYLEGTSSGTTSRFGVGDLSGSGSFVKFDVNTLTVQGTLQATAGHFGGATGVTINASGLTVSSTGIINSTGTTYNSGTGQFDGTGGFFLGRVGGAYQFFVGYTAADKFIRWNGTDLTVRGTINATAGYFGSSASVVAVDSSGLTVSTSGRINASGVTYNSGTAAFDGNGFFLGYAGGAYQFFTGSVASGKFIRWNGTDLTVQGSFNITGGWLGASNTVTISSSGLSVGTTGRINGNIDYNVSFSPPFGGGSDNKGFFLGYANSIYQFFIGHGGASPGQYMYWNGTNLTIKGGVTSDSTLGGRPVTVITGAIDASGDIITTKLRTDSQLILSDFNFGTTNYAGAVKAGDITWNSTTGAITGGSGVVVYRNGIVGAKAGVATFTITTAGDATFAGTLYATAGYIGGTTSGWQITSGTISNYNVASGRTTTLTSDAKITISNPLTTMTLDNASNQGSITISGTYQAVLTAGAANSVLTLGSGSARSILNQSSGLFLDDDGVGTRKVTINTTSPVELRRDGLFLGVGTGKKIVVGSSTYSSIQDITTAGFAINVKDAIVEVVSTIPDNTGLLNQGLETYRMRGNPTTANNEIYLRQYFNRHTFGSTWDGVGIRFQHHVYQSLYGFIEFNSAIGVAGRDTDKSVAIGSGVDERLRINPLSVNIKDVNLRIYSGSTQSARIDYTNGRYFILGSQVLDSRKTGWTAATGTATRTSFDTSTVTTAQLAERVKALLDDLISHGLIGA